MRAWVWPVAVVAVVWTSNVGAADTDVQRVVSRAREEVTRGVRYDRRYARMARAAGDVDPSRGACTDVVVRALRAAGFDLQKLVHEDVLADPRAYRAVDSGDVTILHRRVAVLRVFLERHAVHLPRALGSAVERASFRPGDVVVWELGECPACAPRHVGIVSDRVGERGLPLVIHNMGQAAEEDVLEAWPIAGHYRLVR